jgi:hypothetical protein
MLVRVSTSPFPADKELPWDYSTSAFQDWVWEVLLNCGKDGQYPNNVDEAIEIARDSKFTVEVISSACDTDTSPSY